MGYVWKNLTTGFGFKDFKAFNLALFASQWWRIMNKPDSLIFKVLKAKYFPHANPIDVQLKANSSFLWRRFLAGRYVIEKGSIWRVVDNTSIDIWNDR